MAPKKSKHKESNTPSPVAQPVAAVAAASSNGIGAMSASTLFIIVFVAANPPPPGAFIVIPAFIALCGCVYGLAWLITFAIEWVANRVTKREVFAAVFFSCLSVYLLVKYQRYTAPVPYELTSAIGRED